MKGNLKCNLQEEWLVTQQGQDRSFSIHPEQQESMFLFDKAKEYEVEYSLCYIVEFKLYCVKIAKSSFPEKPIEKTYVNSASTIEIINDGESFYIGENLTIEIGYKDDVMKIFVTPKGA
jgi:hypothetical protein